MWSSDNIIKFSHSPEWTDYLKDVYPIPAKFNIPDWYKNLKHSFKIQTVKGCMPFLDSLSAGYILKLPQDMYIAHNVKNGEGNPDSYFKNAIHVAQEVLRHKYAVNIGSDADDFHQPYQLGKCPMHEKNKHLPYYKIINPFQITTPPGYSCLFVPPLNNRDDRFEIISGIVDTDTFNSEVNFPMIINGDKYPVLETTLKRGTPYVQVIPFKREDWKMKINNKEKRTELSAFKKYIQDNYKKIFWKKKKWN
tara:strand:+ start:1400 stop:2149 length:750 start_codon:yes stop_codon:yes gene_type:complete